tara:strand:- start:460 stop:834 length:375 start_codon:yes stop_codon:yes gene_type:complete
MSDLKSFLSTDMEGCPPFYFESGRFMQVDLAKQIVYWDRSLNKFLTTPRIKVEPSRRMKAICGTLFKLINTDMGSLRRITISESGVIEGYVAHWGADWETAIPLSINPFLHTDITEITREELGL